MVTTNFSTKPDTRLDTDTERQHMLAREADARGKKGADQRRRLTLEGLADVDAGRLIDDEAMQAWPRASEPTVSCRFRNRADAGSLDR